MIVRLCGSKGAFEVLPEYQTRLDFNKLKREFKVVIETPQVLIIQDQFEVSCMKNGKLLIKKCINQVDAEQQAKKIYEVIRGQ
ncbi:hypothetical protein HZB00_00370 [Candidatus Woesearchaeota archaeon]|nr:hypothetical protein [Candidatus Woesearchaeota archaeon]